MISMPLPIKKIPLKSMAHPIGESSVAPGMPSRFVRKVRDPNAGKVAVTASGVPVTAMTEIDFCEQLLIDGFVQSYVDFFHLTHRVDPSVVDPANAGQQIKVSTKDMIFIRDNLVGAESNRRQGNTQGVYSSFNKLADFYEAQLDYETAVFFHEKCLDIATMTSDVQAEMGANHALGTVYQKMNNFESAVRFHEEHERVSVSIDMFDQIIKANAQLYKVYTVLADNTLKNEDGVVNYDGALELYNKSLVASRKSMDKAAEGEANAKIGSLLLKIGQTEESVPFLRQQSQIAADNGNLESRCRACSALALAFDTLGQGDKALAELMLVSTISEQAGDIMLESQANRALGTMYSKVGRMQDSIDALSKHFDLLKTILAKKGEIEGSQLITARDLDLARVYVGVAKGNMLLGSYYVAIQYDFPAVLAWKLNRSVLPSVKKMMNIPETEPAEEEKQIVEEAKVENESEMQPI